MVTQEAELSPLEKDWRSTTGRLSSSRAAFRRLRRLQCQVGSLQSRAMVGKRGVAARIDEEFA